MFGYVKPFKPELKVREFEMYRSVYCTVCKRIGKSYGHAMRFSLSYDFAFLAMLGISLEKDPPELKKSHCVYNPLKKCSYTCGYDTVFDYTCAASVIMLYYKMCDDIRDSGFFKSVTRRAYRALINNAHKKAACDYPELERIVSDMDLSQIAAESAVSAVDAAAEPTAAALGKICAGLSQDEVSKRVLERIGYCVGKWVYLADALDDMDDDRKHGNFNPLLSTDIQNAVGNLNVCSNEAGASYELIADGVYAPILKNIFYLGMPNVIKTVIKSKENDK